MTNSLGDAPIQPELKATMNKLGRLLDVALNSDDSYTQVGSPEDKRRWGFCLMVFPFKDFDGRANYLSNANRDDVLVLLKEQIRRFEGAPDVTGHG